MSKKNPASAPVASYVPAPETLAALVTFSEFQSKYETSRETLKKVILNEVKQSTLPLAKALPILNKALRQQVNPVTNKLFTDKAISRLFLSLDLRTRAKRKVTEKEENPVVESLAAAILELVRRDAESNDERVAALKKALLSLQSAEVAQNQN